MITTNEPITVTYSRAAEATEVRPWVLTAACSDGPAAAPRVRPEPGYRVVRLRARRGRPEMDVVLPSPPRAPARLLVGAEEVRPRPRGVVRLQERTRWV